MCAYSCLVQVVFAIQHNPKYHALAGRELLPLPPYQQLLHSRWASQAFLILY